MSGLSSSVAVRMLRPRKTQSTVSSMPTLPSFHLLHLASQRADNIFADQGSALTPRQYVVLAMLEGREGDSQTDIVRATGIDRSTMAELVKRLLAAGYVRRQRSKTDARVKVVRLTDTGRKVLGSSRAAATLTEERLFAPVAASQRARFLAQLTRVAKGTAPSED
jgi:DNA-binding MarR family transcriptional regulator